MANTYKNIVITPNIGNTSDPQIVFSGANVTVNTDVSLFVYPASNGTLSFEGSAGQLFSITNDLSNLIFSVADVSGIPSLEVYANGLVSVIPFSGNVVFGNTTVNITANSTGTLTRSNSTVNSTHTASLLQIANSTSIANLTALDLKIGATTVVNSTQITATLHVGNVSGTYANITGQVNTVTLYAATSANIASAVQANATGVYTTGTMNAASHTVGTAFTANSTVVNAVAYYSGTLLVANSTVSNATHLGGTAASGYQTTAGLSANVATLTSNNATNLGGTAAASYVQNTDSRTLSGNLVISGTSFTPSSNTILLGNSTQRWVLSANTGSFSGAVSGITTLAAGNTTITGFANVTSTIQGGSSLTIAGALSGVTTAAMGNTTITGFANVTTSVNSALFSVGTSFIANTTGAYHTGTMNAASHTVGTAFTANSTVVNAVAYYSGTLLVANSTVSNATHLVGATWAAPAALGSSTANSGAFTTLTTSSTSLLGGYAQIASYSSMLGVKFPGAGTQYGLALQPAADSTNMITFFNAANLAVGSITQTATTLSYNGTSAVLAYANVSGQVNTATLYAATSANIASIVQANSLGVHVGANVVANVTTLKVGNTTFTTTNAIFGGTITTNGSIGTAGQVLTSGAGTNAYWSTITGGTTYMKGGSATQGSLASEGQNIFRVNANTINYNTTFVAGENGQATGPVAVASGITLTVQTGARISIV
jgi:hypothetical protein